MKFNEPLSNHVPREQLWADYGGDAHFQYSHADYWPALNRLCEERRAAYKERWIVGGKRIGEYEAYLRGGEQLSLTQLLEQASKLHMDRAEPEGTLDKAKEGENAVVEGLGQMTVSD